ncbi:hypothetical protein FISHEDRAFT_65511 [Fistulina hepatica ATCC 64428]|nr:hypothetical protein FISHEDRAFT_65511 [Fistulina hepatica ATCC 64428]
MEMWIARENAVELIEQSRRCTFTKYTKYERVLIYLPESGALISRLLPRAYLQSKGVKPRDMTFGATANGKPYTESHDRKKPPGCVDPIAYNISHDHGMVVMACAPGKRNPPAYSLGVDVMKVGLRTKESFPLFVDVFSDQMTALERELVLNVPVDEGLRRFFWIWTMKEAYTKALGVGLQFDFNRLEFDMVNEVVRVDGQPLEGWRFHRCSLDHPDGEYLLTIAEFVGGDGTVIVTGREPQPWLRTVDAVEFVKATITKLKDESLS